MMHLATTFRQARLAFNTNSGTDGADVSVEPPPAMIEPLRCLNAVSPSVSVPMLLPAHRAPSSPTSQTSLATVRNH